MLLHEFQAKELFERFGIRVPRGRVAASVAEAERAAQRLGGDRWAIKAQVRATDRRGVGGVRFSASPDGVAATAELMLGQPLAARPGSLNTHPEPVKLVLVEQAFAILRQLYLALVLDRGAGGFVFLASRAGGEGIEYRLANEPGLMSRFAVLIDDTGAAVADFAAVARGLGLADEASVAVADIAARMAKLAIELDATQVEINPLALTVAGDLVALDGKVVLDDNALFRHPVLSAFRDAVEREDGNPEELAADERQLNYTRLDGEIGLVANGAGLGLASLDLIVEAGGRPANFMDVRTTATSLDISYGLEQLLGDPGVRAILVNVHGGGMQRCDTIAEGVLMAAGRASRRIPIVVRMAGNSAEFGIGRLKQGGLDLVIADDMEQAARTAVARSR